MKLFTIGVSKKSAESFFALLKENRVEKIIDIRLKNKSQLLGFAKGPDLKYFSEECHHIKYEHLPLFAPTEELLKKYKKDKDWLSYEAEFLKILDSRPIVDGFQKTRKGSKNICLLCSEPKPEKCHRRLVAEYVAILNSKIKIIHL